MNITIHINKAQAFDEVAKTTAYVGAHLDLKVMAYERVAVTDGDREMLERYWREACASVTTLLRPFLTSVSPQPRPHATDISADADYVATLAMSDRYDTQQTDSLNADLFSFAVNSIVSKWFMIANKEESAGYMAAAQGAMENAKIKLHHKTAPTPPINP